MTSNEFPIWNWSRVFDGTSSDQDTDFGLLSEFLSLGYLLQVLVLMSGWQQVVKWVMLVFLYVDDESTEGIVECL